MQPEKPISAQRRRFLGHLLMATTWTTLAACGRERDPMLRIATNVFPGYELMYLAAERGHLGPAVHMVEMPSSTASLQALAAGNVEGAALTLDEVISALADNMPLKVVAVLDVSLGADMLIVKPGIATLAELRGKRIGVEQTAVGAVMLDAVLTEAGLDTKDVQLVYATVDRQRDLYLKDQVDALVTFEPVPSQLAQSGARKLFDSSAVPERIVDVLAVRPEVTVRNTESLRHLLAGHFQALAELHSSPETASEVIARRLGIPPAEVPTAYAGLELPDAAANQAWLGGRPSRLEQAAADLQQIMLRAGLIRRMANLAELVDDRFLPRTGER